MKRRKIALIIGIVLAGGICFLPARSFAEQKPSYKISISAAYNNDFDKEIIIVYGKTDLPDKSPVDVKLKTKDGLVASKQALVKKKQFCVGFGPFKQKLKPASYSVEAEHKGAEGETIKGSCAIQVGPKQ